MRWKYETYSEMIDRLKEWHPWFAWHPVWDKGHAFWLETVLRRGEYWIPECWLWDYRALDSKGEDK